MEYLDAIKTINKKYNTTRVSENIELIKLNKLLDFSNYYFIAVVNEKGKAVLTDMAKTCDIIEKKQVEWKNLCAEYNLKFKNYNIYAEFNSINDLYNFISLLDSLKK